MHKGLQDIEDISGEENEREHEEEDRREREHMTRLKAVQGQRQHTLSVSVPPESPITPQSASWGAPPPLPAHYAAQ